LGACGVCGAGACPAGFAGFPGFAAPTPVFGILAGAGAGAGGSPASSSSSSSPGTGIANAAKTNKSLKTFILILFQFPLVLNTVSGARVSFSGNDERIGSVGGAKPMSGFKSIDS
jgi:hypothetical protein